MPTVNLAITDTADDGSEIVGLGLSTSLIRVGFDDNPISTEFVAFLRFLDVTIPPGAVVSAATLTVNVTAVVGTPNTNVFGVDADNAAAFADPGNLPSAAVLTTASADSDPAGTGSHQIDVTSIAQEVLGRAGWASGNALALVFVDSAGTGEHNFDMEDFEAAGTAHATLDITYTEASTGTPTMFRSRRGITQSILRNT